jgi:hypothetical protein
MTRIDGTFRASLSYIDAGTENPKKKPRKGAKEVSEK